MTPQKIGKFAKLLLALSSISIALTSAPAASAAQRSAAQVSGSLNTSSKLEERRKAFKALIAEQWEVRLRRDPEFASGLGDMRYNDQLRDFSEAGLAAERREEQDFLRRFQNFDNRGFSAEEKLNQALMVSQLKQKLGEKHFEFSQTPMRQNSGDHLDVPGMAGWLPFVTVKDYDDYLARLRQVPRLFDENIVQMRKGLKSGRVAPQFLMEKVASQCETLAAMGVTTSPFARPYQNFSADIPQAEQQRLRTAIQEVLTRQVVPAYQKLAKFMREEYAPRGRQQPGIWAVPDGPARYRFQVNSATTTNMSPQAIHQLGLREVQRIEAQMLAVAKKQGYSDLKGFNAALAVNPDLRPKSAQHILDLYAKYIDQMYEQLPQLFGRLPKAKLTIVAEEAFREKEAAGASYNHGTPDGSRPGRVTVNTGDFAQRMTLSIETTALHEGVPGHHMQVSIAQELEQLPAFRQQGEYTAYVEGWALYSESLGEEAGFFQDPFSYYGHLQDEMLRAIRLVVDTGLHYKKWSRQQVVDFFHAHSGIEEVEVQSETDRYIGNPGQALGYKIGQLKIMSLRQYAAARLGKKFDIRGFHDQILGAGALPLDLLEQRIHAWVAQQ